MLVTIILSACQAKTLPSSTSLPNLESTVATLSVSPSTESTLSTSLQAPENTNTPSPSPTEAMPYSPLVVMPAGLVPTTVCPEAPASRMQVGDQVYINRELTMNLRLRREPGLAEEIIETSPGGTAFRVVGGPQCADQYTWWQLESASGLLGWSAEGEFGLMYLIPVGLLAYRDQYLNDQLWQMSKLTLLDTNGNLVKVAAEGFLGAWRLSPDGSQIAYHEGDPDKPGLYIVSLLDDEKRQINQDSALMLRFSPDGRSLAYFNNIFHLKVIEIENNNVLYEEAFEDINFSSFAWSPDGLKLALLMDDLRILDLKTGQWRVLSRLLSRPEDIPGGGIDLLAWSPDGQQLVYLKDNSLRRIWANGAGETILSDNAGVYVFPTWSPGGGEIAYVVYNTNPELSRAVLMIHDVNSKVVTTLVEDMDPFSGIQWSADGGHLLYVDGNRSVNIYNLANGSQKAITVFTQPGSISFDPQWVTYR